MVRKKIVHAWIANDVIRRSTLKKRRKVLLKKISEITTLCDVQACGVVYGPDHDAEPEVWPNVPEATTMLQSFQELPEITKCKKMSNQETFLQEKLIKTTQQYKRLENQIQEMEDSVLIYEFMSGRDIDELDLQQARKAYYIAGSKQRVGNEQKGNTMAVQGSSSEGVNYPPLRTTDYNLDDVIVSCMNKPTMQNETQMVSTNFNRQNQLTVPSFNHESAIQQPVINYVENQNQMMIVPYINDQMLMHQQANIVGSSSNNMVIAPSNQATNVDNGSQAMASSADEGHQHLANMEEDCLWMNPKLFD